MHLAIPLLLLFVSGCLNGPTFLKQRGELHSAVTFAPQAVATTEQNGVTVATIGYSATTAQQVTAPSSSPISGTVLTFPPGTIAFETQIAMQVGQNLATNAVASQLGLGTTVTNAGQSVAITSSLLVDATQPFTVALTIPQGASLVDSPFSTMGIVYQVKKAAAGGATFTGLITRDKLTIAGGSASFEASYFGTYQVVFFAQAVTRPVEIAATAVATPDAGQGAAPSSGPGEGALSLTSIQSQTLILAHKAPSGAVSVVLRRLVGTDCSQATPKDGVSVPLTVAQTTVTDSGLNLGTSYCYRAFWYDANGAYNAQTSALPSYAGTGPGAGSLGVTSIGQTTATLSHTPPTSPGYARVELLRRGAADCSSGSGGTAVPVALTAATVSDTGLTPGATYCYRVTWYDAFGNGSTSIVNNVTTNTPNPNCNLTTGHVGYYKYGTVSLVYTCNTAVIAVNTANMPSFLTSSFSGNQVHIDGTATTIGTTSWSFAVNGQATGGGAAAITTKVISDTALMATVLANHTFTTAESGTALDLAYQLGLDANWDGSAVDLVVGSVASDIPGLSLTCTGPAQLCAATGSSSSGTFHKPLDLQWSFSAYDQGSYYVTITPHAIIDGHDYTLPSVTTTLSVPMQTSDGNVALTTNGDPAGTSVNDPISSYSLAISTSASSPLHPVLGVIYANELASYPYYHQTLQKLFADRTDDPTSSTTTGISASNNMDLSSSWTRGGHLRAMNDGSWAALSSINSSTWQLQYQHIVTATSTPTSDAPVSLNSVGSSGELVDMDLTEPFNDAGTTRLAFAFTIGNFYGDHHCHIEVGKFNPAGTTLATVSDDARYDAAATHPSVLDYAGGTGGECDRPKIRYYYRDSAHNYLYVAYRSSSNLGLARLDADYGTDYNLVGPSTVSGVLGSGIGSATSGGQPGTHDIAVAAIAGVASVGVVYLDTTHANKCYFRRYSEDLATATTPIEIASATCREPQLQFNPASGRFIITYVSDNYNVATSEITVGTPDTASTPIDVLHTNQVSSPINHLAASFYSAGNWVGLVYHVANDATVKVHGYHVSDK